MDEVQTPSRERKRVLKEGGLGEKKVVFNNKNGSFQHLKTVLEQEYPLLKDLEGATNKNSPFENSFKFFSTSKTIARQVARNVAQCNIPDHATRILKINSLRDKLQNKLHSVIAPLGLCYDHECAVIAVR